MKFVSVVVVSENSEHLAKAAEVMARAAVGLLLEDMPVRMSFGEAEEMEPDED